MPPDIRGNFPRGEVLAIPRRSSTINPMATVQITKRLNHRHDAIIEWLLANPDKGQGECAVVIGMSATHMSIIVNSDMFKARYAERAKEVHDFTQFSIHDKLTGIAHAALDKLAEKLDDVDDPQFLLSASDKLLHRLGFAPQAQTSVHVHGNGPVQVNTVDRSVIEDARRLRDRALSVEIVDEDDRVCARPALGQMAEPCPRISEEASADGAESCGDPVRK